MSEITLTPQSWCPRCRHSLNTAGTAPGVEAEKERPSEGDLTICGNCDAILAFSTGMQLRAVTDVEVAELPVDERRAIAATQAFTRRVRAGRPS